MCARIGSKPETLVPGRPEHFDIKSRVELHTYIIFFFRKVLIAYEEWVRFCLPTRDKYLFYEREEAQKTKYIDLNITRVHTLCIAIRERYGYNRASIYNESRNLDMKKISGALHRAWTLYGSRETRAFRNFSRETIVIVFANLDTTVVLFHWRR